MEGRRNVGGGVRMPNVGRMEEAVGGEGACEDDGGRE
jgi:hypothetical protein